MSMARSAALAASLLFVAAGANAAPGTLELRYVGSAVDESAASLRVAVRRIDGSSGAVSVDWATADGSALAGQDYVAASGTLRWADGETATKFISVALVDDDAFEKPEIFTIGLANPQGGATLGERDLYIANVQDDDSAYNFEKASLHVGEDGGVARVGVVRSGKATAAGAVHFAAVGGRAVAGKDYDAVDGTLTWAAGETGVKYFNVVVRNDAVNERDEAVVLSLDAPVGGSVGEKLPLSKLIIDNDDCPLAEGTVVAHTWSANAGTHLPGVGTVEAATPPDTYALPVGCRVAEMSVRITWATPAEDLDLYVTKPDGSVASDANFQTSGEGSATVVIPGPRAGNYSFEARGYVSARTPVQGTVTLTVGGSSTTGEPGTPVASGRGIDDVVVIAVVDTGLNPYHLDFLADFLPQHLNTNPNDDLPLRQDPSTWVPGYPAASAFGSFEALNLSLTTDPNAITRDLHAQDQAEWSKITISEGTDNGQVHMYWFPGTKIIGHVVFSGGSVGDPWFTAALGPETGPRDTFAQTSHGVGTTSVSVGNFHGSCPHCLLVMVDGTGEQASEWVEKQDWIDLQSNSWGQATAYRERAYAGSDTELQRQTVERGQSIFFSAGNGQENAFVVPNTTLLSSQEGPDWIITVGATTPGGQSYTGAGKPADVAGMGEGYPSAYNTGDDSPTEEAPYPTSNEGAFSGTSNATPQVAGMYGEVLYRLRRMLAGPSRTQEGGVIAAGKSGCGAANPGCALADGRLTVHELRDALFQAARRTPQGSSVGGLVTLPQTENAQEAELLSEGHGTYFGRVHSGFEYEQEIRRIANYARGLWYQPESAEQRDWFIADSACRQAGWGSWSFGEAAKGAAPAADPSWPVRSFYTQLCPSVLPPLVEAQKQYWGLP